MLRIVHSDEKSIIPATQSLSVRSDIVPVQLSEESSEIVVVKDVRYLDSVGATIQQNRQIQAAASPPLKPVLFESLNPAIATVDSNGYVQNQSNGTVGILVKNGAIRKRVDHTSETIGGQTSRVFQNYLTGSLGKLLNDQIDEEVAGGGSLQVFSLKNNTTPEYTRHDCWIEADLTCWPVWNSKVGNKFNGCLISPRHMVFAAHCGITNGTTIRFVTNSNTVVTRTVGNRTNIANFDLQIAVLDSDVPESISFSKVLPEDWADYFTFESIPVLCGNQHTELVLRDCNQFVVSSESGLITHEIAEGDRAAFSKNIISGDSGSPVFMLIDDQLVVLGTHYTAIGAPLISAHIDQVNAAMTSLGGGYQLTQIDLTDYQNYGD